MGATCDGGTNFTLLPQVAYRVESYPFDDDEKEHRVSLETLLDNRTVCAIGLSTR